MKKQSLAAAAAVASAFFTVPSTASATSFECKCLDTFAPTVSAGKLNQNGNTFRCGGTFSGEGNGTETGDYNSYVKIWFAEGKSTDNLTTVGVRPRQSSECLNAVYDAQGQHQEWGGAWCDTSSKKDVSGMDLVTQSSGMKLVSGSANTTTKQNKFAAFYAPKTGGNFLQAVCVEDK